MSGEWGVESGRSSMQDEITERGTFPDIVLHHMPKGLPASKPFQAGTTWTQEDVAICSRILAAYRKAKEYERKYLEPPKNDIWEHFQATVLPDWQTLLEKGSPEQVAEILAKAMQTQITHGLGPGHTVFESFKHKQLQKEVNAITIDRFIALAEAMALIPFENPEQGRWGANIYVDLNLLVGSVEKALGIQILSPPVCGMFGVDIGGRCLHIRTSNNAYIAHRVKQLLGKTRGKRICEIGAGMGLNAFMFSQLGMRYLIIDIPVTNVLQAYTAIKLHGAGQVRLYGEKHSSAQVVILPYWELDRLPSKSIDLFFNEDSMPEIEPGYVEHYLEQIARCGKSYFVSINQEGEAPAGLKMIPQIFMPQMMERHQSFRRIARFASWMRRGYIEEVYEIAPTSGWRKLRSRLPRIK